MYQKSICPKGNVLKGKIPKKVPKSQFPQNSIFYLEKLYKPNLQQYPEICSP